MIRTTQPQVPTRIDWNNPLARGLIYAVNHAVSPFDMIDGRGTVADYYNVKSIDVRKGLTGVSAAAGVRSVTNPSDALRINSSYVAHAGVICVDPITEAWGGVFGVSDVSYNASFGIQRYDTSNDIAIFRSNDAAARFTDTASLFASGNPVVYVAESSGHTSGDWNNLWINGAKFTTTQFGSPITQAGAGVRAAFLSGRGWNASQTYGLYAAHFTWNRPLTDWEIASFTANPWQLFAPDRRPLYTGMGSGSWTPLEVDG